MSNKIYLSFSGLNVEDCKQLDELFNRKGKTVTSSLWIQGKNRGMMFNCKSGYSYPISTSNEVVGSFIDVSYGEMFIIITNYFNGKIGKYAMPTNYQKSWVSQIPSQHSHIPESFNGVKVDMFNVQTLKTEILETNSMRFPTFSEEFDKYTINLTEKAHAGKIDPLIGRTEELQHIVKCLSRRRKNNPLLVGEAGVGKSHLATGLALDIYNKEDYLPEDLHKLVVIEVDIAAMVAGAKFRGDAEERIKLVLKEAEDQGNILLFIDEIHMIIGAGKGQDSSMDFANILKPYLSSGAIRCMGATTYAEYQQKFEKDVAMPRRFQKIDIVETTEEETLEIIKGLRKTYENHHNIELPDEIATLLIKKANKFISTGFMPDKAVDVMDLVMTQGKLKGMSTVTEDILDDVVSKIARIPAENLNTDQASSLQILDQKLKSSVFGQDESIDKLVEVVQISRAGLGDENKPVGSFLMAGSTGTGKTELALQLAKGLGLPILRFDMSEYQQETSINRLLGSDHGYIGSEQGGVLTNALIKHPSCVLLLDEVEKAHPRIFTILLQVMDNGFLTDSLGRTVDCRNIVLLMTTNAGAAAAEEVKQPMGFLSHASEKKEEVVKDAISDMFAPEFRARMSATLMFNNLTTSVIETIADKFVAEMSKPLKEKGVEIKLTKAARTWFIENGFDAAMGARPMKNLISKELKAKLAKEILFGKLKNGGEVEVCIKDGKITLKTTEAA